jgi:hypothetical protein
MRMTSVARNATEMVARVEEWQAAMVQAGWTEAQVLRDDVPGSARATNRPSTSPDLPPDDDGEHHGEDQMKSRPPGGVARMCPDVVGRLNGQHGEQDGEDAMGGCHFAPAVAMPAFKTARDKLYTHPAPSMLAPDLLAGGFPVGDAMEYDGVRCRLAIL